MSRKLPARLLLVLQSLLGVIGGPGCVFHGALHVRINSEGFAGFVRSAVGGGSLHLFTISPWFSTRTAMSMTRWDQHALSRVHDWAGHAMRMNTWDQNRLAYAVLQYQNGSYLRKIKQMYPILL